MTSSPGGPADHSARVAQLFDSVAAVYDGTGVDFFAPIARGLLELVPPQPGERWLDLGCGRGAVALPAAEAGAAVTARDISPAMVADLRATALSRGLPMDVEVDDAQAPDLPAESFDVIASSAVLFFLADPAAALRAWLPLLVPGGRLAVTTFGPVSDSWKHVDDVFTAYLPPAMVDARTTGTAGPFASDSGMEQLVREAGFADVRTATWTLPVVFADAEQWHAFSWSTGQRRMWLAVPEPDRAAVRAEAIERVSSYAADDGTVTFTQGVRHTLALRRQ